MQKLKLFVFVALTILLFICIKPKEIIAQDYNYGRPLITVGPSNYTYYTQRGTTYLFTADDRYTGNTRISGFTMWPEIGTLTARDALDTSVEEFIWDPGNVANGTYTVKFCAWNNRPTVGQLDYPFASTIPTYPSYECYQMTLVVNVNTQCNPIPTDLVITKNITTDDYGSVCSGNSCGAPTNTSDPRYGQGLTSEVIFHPGTGYGNEYFVKTLNIEMHDHEKDINYRLFVRDKNGNWTHIQTGDVTTANGPSNFGVEPNKFCKSFGFADRYRHLHDDGPYGYSCYDNFGFSINRNIDAVKIEFYGESSAHAHIKNVRFDARTIPSCITPTPTPSPTPTPWPTPYPTPWPTPNPTPTPYPNNNVVEVYSTADNSTKMIEHNRSSLNEDWIEQDFNDSDWLPAKDVWTSNTNVWNECGFQPDGFNFPTYCYNISGETVFFNRNQARVVSASAEINQDSMETQFFRKRFRLPGDANVTSAKLYLSMDNVSKIWIDENEIFSNQTNDLENDDVCGSAQTDEGNIGGSLRMIDVTDFVKDRQSDHIIAGNLVNTLSCNSNSPMGIQFFLRMELDRNGYGCEYYNNCDCNYYNNCDINYPTRYQDLVRIFYRSILRREADSAGLGAYTNQLYYGASASNVAHSLFFSQEFYNQNVSNAEYVARLYRTMLNRNPSNPYDLDHGNYLTWLEQLDGGYISRETMFWQFAWSSEYRNRLIGLGVNP